MTRQFALVFAVCLGVAGSAYAQTREQGEAQGLAQTREQVDSMKALYLKALKAMPAADPNQATYRREARVVEALHFSKVRDYAPEGAPAIFESAFFKGTRAIEDSMNLDFYAVDIGEIFVETGKIIACDPMVMNTATPFLQTFPVGSFPVQLAIARFSGGGKERVAFSRINFSDKPVVRWEFALQSGNQPLPIEGDTLYGYGVDGGMGIFIDAQANDAFSDLRKYDNNLWNAVFTDAMSKHDHITWQYTLFAFQRHNLACFTTGVGDGLYGTYVGYDEQGQICRLLTDFGLVRWWRK